MSIKTQLKIKLDIAKGQDKKYLIQELKAHFEQTLLMLQYQLELVNPYPDLIPSSENQSEFQEVDLHFFYPGEISLLQKKPIYEVHNKIVSNCVGLAECKHLPEL